MDMPSPATKEELDELSTSSHCSDNIDELPVDMEICKCQEKLLEKNCLDKVREIAVKVRAHEKQEEICFHLMRQSILEVEPDPTGLHKSSSTLRKQYVWKLGGLGHSVAFYLVCSLPV